MTILQEETDKFIENLKVLKFRDIEIKEIAYGNQIFAYLDGKKCNFRIYYSKKKGITEDFSQIKDDEILELFTQTAKTMSKTKKDAIRTESDDFDHFTIGSDEAGKGDVVGPLIIAAVYNDDKLSETFKLLDIKDSKLIKSFSKLEEAYKNIISTAIYHIEVIEPEEYNKLYKVAENINKVLALGHQRALKGCLDEAKKQKKKIDKIIIDKFSKKQYFNSLKKEVDTLVETPKAERFSSVAAASILARYTHLKYYESLNKKYKSKDISFSPGMNPNNITMLNKYLDNYKEASLFYLTKLHFKTIDEILKSRKDS
jgi:ribonuclease HIII